MTDRDVPGSANHTYFALSAVQHRGQGGAGIAIADGHELHEHAGMGLVSRVVTEQSLDAHEAP